MAKFSLLTTLTLQAAGFNKGISQATKGAKGLADGVKTAGSTMAGAFSPLQSVLGNLGNQLGGVTDVALGGIRAFKSMIPAINGIKTALISTGIGAIVVALGTAFAALMSYLKGTEEGASKLAKVMGFMKGVFNAILQRVQLLGEAVSLVFEGKFKEAGEKLKAAFQGGLLQEIKDDAAEAVGYAERENKLWRDKLDLKKRESDAQAEINRLKLIAWNNTGEIDAATRQQALNRSKELELGIVNEKVRLAEEEYSIVKSQNAMGKNSREDTEKEVDLYVAINNIKTEYLGKQKEYLEKQVQINNALKTTAEEEKKIKDAVEALTGLKPIELTITPKIDKSKIKLEGLQAEPPEFITPESPAITAATLFEDSWKAATDSVYMMLSNTAIGSQELFMALSGAMVNSLKELSSVLSEGADSFKEFAKNALNAIRKVVAGLIGEGIAAAITNALKTTAITPWLIPVVAGLAAGLAKTAFAALIPKFHTGGIVGGVGDIPAILKPREMVLTEGQQANLFDMINNGSSMAGEVTFRIDGTQLVGVLNNFNRQTNSYR